MTIEVNAQGELPLIEVDPVRIREVMTNLLSNALRHTPSGGSVIVSVAAPPRGSESRIPDPGSRIVVEVRDCGSGMAPEAIARAFDRFY